ncbi:hypothetical protein DM01DRAFT_1395713 [Hesseltinella vesiculosa]|uniref:Uncharacterized protein n=1 Tax=Hesseltinella vesiculosa TaxID=101127 RepID=A0A1X2G957_9FUNG|nr:hypothetical protein DM01DRAFT_1395713 [Hesseltinella vesiculosa]
MNITCPLCQQQFPAFDQRGFRNAGYTAHYNRCLEKLCQKPSPTEDKAVSRAIRFAKAIKRKLLPARPSLPLPKSLPLPMIPVPAQGPSSQEHLQRSLPNPTVHTSKVMPSSRHSSGTLPAPSYIVPTHLPMLSPHLTERPLSQDADQRQRREWIGSWPRRRHARRHRSPSPPPFTIPLSAAAFEPPGSLAAVLSTSLDTVPLTQGSVVDFNSVSPPSPSTVTTFPTSPALDDLGSFSPAPGISHWMSAVSSPLTFSTAPQANLSLDLMTSQAYHLSSPSTIAPLPARPHETLPHLLGHSTCCSLCFFSNGQHDPTCLMVQTNLADLTLQ